MSSGQAPASERSLEHGIGRQGWSGTCTTSSLQRVRARRVPPEAGRSDLCVPALFRCSPGGPKDSLQKADPDSGVGPRRCTDLVCWSLNSLLLPTPLWSWGPSSQSWCESQLRCAVVHPLFGCHADFSDCGQEWKRCRRLSCTVDLICLCTINLRNKDGRAYSDVRRLTHGMDFEVRKLERYRGTASG